MSYYTKDFVREAIDDDLFEHVKEYLISNNHDHPDLEEIILKSKRPIHRKSGSSSEDKSLHLPLYRGFVLERSLQLSLSRFSNSSNLLLSPQFKTIFAFNEYRINLNKYGNIVFYGSNGNMLTEIDSLYEFHYGSDIVPIIFEISYTRGGNKSKLKREIVDQFYDLPAYFCRIQPIKNE